MKPNRLQHLEHEIENALGLGVELLGGADDVGVVLSEAANAHQAVQRAGALVAITVPSSAQRIGSSR